MSLLETIKNLFCKIVAETSAPEQTNKPSEVITKKAAPVAATKQATKVSTAQLQIPEDSTLKRHFISALKCQIESEMPPRPTESTLKRHYDSTVQSKLENLLG